MEKVVVMGKYYKTLGKGGLLTYNPKTSEYTCYVNQIKQWTLVVDDSLFKNIKKFDDYDELVNTFPVYAKYTDAVHSIYD